MADGNKNQHSSDILQAFVAMSERTMEKLHVCDIGKILSIDGNYSQVQLVNSPQTEIKAYVPSSLQLLQNDIVLIIYTDKDTRQNLKRLNKNLEVEEVNQDSVKHSLDYGIIIMKII